MEKYSFRINGKDFEVEVGSVTAGEAVVSVNGEEYRVETNGTEATPAGEFQAAEGSAAGSVSAKGTTTGESAAACDAKASPVSSSKTSGEAEVTSPLPGVIVEIQVSVGQSIKAGECVAVLEAMKMENEIEATASGTVTAVCAAKGDSVPEGAVIVRIG